MSASMILWDIVEEHLDEAAFLWSQWERALVSPEYTLRDVMEGPEERLLANLSGLRAGGAEVAERLLLPAIEEEEPGRLCAAALALLSEEGAVEGRHEGELVKPLVTGEEPSRGWLARALSLGGGRGLSDRLIPLLREPLPEPVLESVLDILDFRRVDPGTALDALLRSREPGLCARALRLMARVRGKVEPETLRRALGSPAPEVQEAALEAGLLVGSRAAWGACRELMAASGPLGDKALLLFAMGAHPRELERLLDMLGSEERRAAVLWALGFCGQTVAAEACLEWMQDEQVARLAGEAFSAITGLVLEGRLTQESVEPEAEEPIPLEEENLDACLIPRPEEALALPEPEAVRNWWSESAKAFTPGVRYLYGVPFTVACCLEALREAPMRRRHMLALELAIRSRGQHVLQTRALAREQWAHLARIRWEDTRHLTRSFSELMTL